MTPIEVIEKILNAKSVVDIFPDLGNWKKLHTSYVKLIHPDHCAEKNAVDAMFKLNSFVNDITKGKKHNDDAGIITYTINTGKIVGQSDLLKKSLDNYNYLMGLKDEHSNHFKQYIPTSMTKISDTELQFTLPKRGVPLSSIGTLPHEHANWILSRILEFSAWLNQVKMVHAGINPDSLYVLPENHGLVCISFYHMTKLDGQLKTVSANYSKFYPAKIFDLKRATSNIDVELAKRTAIYLLGDASGSGVKLRKTHNLNVLNFIFKEHLIPLEAYKEYREILKKNFDTKKFHVLNV